MEKNLKIISGIPLFSGLTPKQLQEIEQITVDRHYRKGDAVFYEGDDGDGFYVVVEGLVKIYKVSSEGKEQILHILGPGEPFGEVPVFSGQSFPANSEAIVECQLLFFPRSAMAERIAANPSLALNMLAVLSMRLRQFTVQIENLSLKEVPGRLVYLAEEQNSKDIVTLEISKGQLASLLGTIPETLSRIFSKMSGQHLISVKDRNIHLLDLNGLQTLSEEGKILL